LTEQNPSTDPLQEIPRKALKKIRAICRGNGAAPDSIQIKSMDGELVEFEAYTHIELQPDIREDKVSGKVESGKILQENSQVNTEIGGQISHAIGNTESRKDLANILLERPDKGFSMHGKKFSVPALNQDFSIFHACGHCKGQGQEECPRCKGVMREICNKCHGKTMVPCQYCSATGSVNGPDGKPMQCNRCFGHKQIICTYCQKAGTVACQQCNATGAIRCSVCKGAAYYTDVIKVLMQINTAFEIDRTTIPNPTVKLIEDIGEELAAKKHIALEAQQIKRDDGGLAIQYNGNFPFGDLGITINGKLAKCQVFGYNAKFIKLPNILDGLTTAPRQILEKAAKGKGNVLSQINQASKTRIFGEALQLALLLPRKKAMTALRKKYPIGISPKAIKHIIQISYLALQNATRRSRSIGFGFSALMIALFETLYFIGPLRLFILKLTGSEPIVALIDFILIPLGALICRMMAQRFAKQPLRKALGAYYPAGKKKRIKTTIEGNVQSYIISGAIFVICVYGAKLFGQPPAWLPF
jgi:hypothetical protein